MKKIIFVLCMATFFCFSSIVDAFPIGNYMVSCHGCSMSNGNLHCMCERKNKTWASAFLYKPNRCASISNFNGILHCNIGQLPRGNYRFSCHSCVYMHGNLSCMCRTMSGNFRYTRLPNAAQCSQSIQNNNGNLTCGPAIARRLPFGSYRLSCQNCKSNGRMLYCKCFNSFNVLQNTVLSNIQSCHYVVNLNGKLACR